MKTVNVILGIATAVILGALINLGIRAFYPEPVQPVVSAYPASSPVVPCASGDAACIKANEAFQAQANAAQAHYQQEWQAYDDAMGIYDRNVFIIANLVGIAIFAAGFFAVFADAAIAARGVPVGAMAAGLWGIVYGYARGWGSVDDLAKFFIGLAVAVAVIGGSMWLIQRHARKHHA